jgi:tetratricopeptide (TPR) repeat protein
MNQKKNQLKIENIEEKEEEQIHASIVEEDSYQYQQETPRRSGLPLVLWTLFVILILGLVSLGVWYKYYREKFPLFTFKEKEEVVEKKTVTTIIKEAPTSSSFGDKPYIPGSSLDPELSRCITLFKDGYERKAFIVCEEYLNRPATDENKSIALTILGIMFDKAARYPLAIEKLRTAVKYDKNNAHAYYNLALAYKHSGDYTEARAIIRKAQDIAPSDSTISLLAGNLLSESNEPTEAIKAYKEGINRSPNDPYLIYNLALNLYKQGNTPEAIDNFRKAIVASGNTGQVAELSNAHLGAIYYHRNEFDPAEHHYREAINLKPNKAKYLYNLGIILLKKDKKEEAIAIFNRALEAGSTDPKIYRYIAESYQDLKMSNNAISTLEKALKIKPDDIDTMFQLADMYYSKGNLSEAESLFRKIVKVTPGDANTESALVNLGIVLDDMERYEEAVQTFEKVIAINPKNSKVYYNLGIAYKNAGQPARAIEEWRKAANLDPSDSKNQEAIGDYFSQSGYHIEASKEYEEITKRDPSNYRVKLKLSDSYLHLKSFDLAEKHLFEVLNYSKNAQEIKMAHRKLALVYAATGGNTQKAVKEAYRASHIDPDDMESKLVLAKTLLDTGSLLDREKAIDELTAIVRSDVEPIVAAKAYNYLGLCYYKNQEYKRALNEFQKAINLDPTLVEAYDNKKAARASYEDSLQNRL